MLKTFNLNYKSNVFYSLKQYNSHYKLYNEFKINLNNYLFKKKIIYQHKYELIDLIHDLSDVDKYQYINLLGGYLNHDYYFKNITFNKNLIFGNIKKIIELNYTNFENLKLNFIKNFVNHIGWGWLVINKNKICLLKTKDNNNPMFSVSLGGFNSIPLIGIDLHEHSYYIDYNSNKKKYIENFLEFLNWYEIENRLQNYNLNLV
ncbi:Fe-Mn family superoxide dismutase [Candidatus Carsonella ruddii]|uniref:Superoxide dismutase n=1 Tax=Candidatus Carsonella ruddii PC isolate NHV TaxID=1202540 RepID=J3TWJ2_CARRU|nr:Fe-Mn family superoxide dismutase [Candidatus Carsonella ruddii]AFP84320.1 superoxide dismutase [Candidatus Carsonella ruddii PC isolate NHV]